MGIMISSESLVKILKAIFEMAWLSCGEINPFQN